MPALGGAQTEPLTEVQYVTGTASTGEWVTYVAERQGFFKAEGLHVNINYAGAPPAITQAVATNAADFGHNGCDSWIVAVVHGLPVKMIGTMFAVNSFSLLVSPDVKTWADLKGKTVMLGTKQDITAIVLAQLAAPHGLKLDDFSIAIGGNSTARYAALMSGNAQGAILAQPFDMLAQSKGMRLLASAIDTMKEWPLSAIAVNPTWAASHRTTVVKFMRALRRAMQYGYTHKADVVDDLVAEVHVDAPTAQRAFDDNWTRWHAFDPGQKFTQANLQYIARLQMGMGIVSAIPPYGDVYDGSFIADIR
jgi:ABC-type nitrate/sulfonate/bicarbonate transport system substrate-binding protein